MISVSSASSHYYKKRMKSWHKSLINIPWGLDEDSSWMRALKQQWAVDGLGIGWFN